MLRIRERNTFSNIIYISSFPFINSPCYHWYSILLSIHYNVREKKKKAFISFPTFNLTEQFMRQDFYLDPFLTSDTSTSINYFDPKRIISSLILFFTSAMHALLVSFPLARISGRKRKKRKKKIQWCRVRSARFCYTFYSKKKKKKERERKKSGEEKLHREAGEPTLEWKRELKSSRMRACHFF